MHGQPIDTMSLLWLYRYEEGAAQMRRMEKEAARTGRGAGGPLSTPHTAIQFGARNSIVLLRTLALLRTTVTSGTTFLQTLRPSAVAQFARHDCDNDTALTSSTLK